MDVFYTCKKVSQLYLFVFLEVKFPENISLSIIKSKPIFYTHSVAHGQMMVSVSLFY